MIEKWKPAKVGAFYFTGLYISMMIKAMPEAGMPDTGSRAFLAHGINERAID